MLGTREDPISNIEDLQDTKEEDMMTDSVDTKKKQEEGEEVMALVPPYYRRLATSILDTVRDTQVGTLDMWTPNHLDTKKTRYLDI